MLRLLLLAVVGVGVVDTVVSGVEAVAEVVDMASVVGGVHAADEVVGDVVVSLQLVKIKLRRKEYTGWILL